MPVGSDANCSVRIEPDCRKPRIVSAREKHTNCIVPQRQSGSCLVSFVAALQLRFFEAESVSEPGAH